MYSYLTQGSQLPVLPLFRCSQGQILLPFLPMVVAQPDPSWPCSTVTTVTMGHTAGYSLTSVCGQINQQICTKGKWCFVPAGQSSVILKTSGQLGIYFWDIFHRYFSHLYRDMSWSVFMDSCQPTVYPTPWFISLFSIHCLTSLIFGFDWGLSAYALRGYSVQPLNIFGS